MKTIAIAVYFMVFLQTHPSFGQLKKNNFPAVKKLDSLFSGYNNSTPGIAVTVLKDGKTILKKAYGMANLEFSVPFTHNTLVRLPYSEGREFISIAATLMEKDSLLHLNDKVRKYFPKLPEWSEPVTIQDLLNHSSGFADEWATLALTQASMANRLEKSQFLNFLYKQPTPSVEPRTGYMYSNSDYGLLRLILEKASGENLAAYMKRRIFEPVGMRSTRLNDVKDEVITNKAFGYTAAEGNTYKLWLQDKTSPGGNYFVLTSANDLEKWAEAHIDPQSFISAAVSRLKQNARPIPVVPGTNYVFGHKLKTIGKYESIVHMGVGSSSYIAYVPEKKIAVILHSNLLFIPRWKLMQDVLATQLNVKLPSKQKSRSDSKPVTLKSEDVKKFEGTYKWNVPLTYQSYEPVKRFMEFIADNEVLKVLYNIGDTLNLVSLAKNTFRDPDYPDLFIFSQAHPDSAMRAVMYSSDGDTVHMERINNSAPKFTRKELQKFAGKYYSNHLDYYWTIIVDENDRLVVKRPTVSDKIVYPFPDGDFMLVMEYGGYDSPGWIRFHYNDKGEVSHITITHPRLMGHRFDKVQ
jgi:CubicO group peptidase (beta-lactamase class C family)